MPALLEVRARPRLRQPLLVAAFSGWGNAGEAATGAAEYLLGSPLPPPIAVVDSEACLDYTAARPLTRRAEGGSWVLEPPVLACYAVERPAAPRDLLVVLGPEPSFHWFGVARGLASLAAELGTTLAITFGGYVGMTSHRRLEVVRRTLLPALEVSLAQLGVADTAYEGPTAFQTALLHACHEAGIPAASLWVATPPYVRGACPPAALALLRVANRLAQAGLDLARLQARATDWSQQIDRMLANNPALREQLSRVMDLETGSPEADTEGREPEAQGDLPSGQDLVEELERFLRRAQQPPEGPSA